MSNLIVNLSTPIHYINIIIIEIITYNLLYFLILLIDIYLIVSSFLFIPKSINSDHQKCLSLKHYPKIDILQS
jgi:hypothetical protein